MTEEKKKGFFSSLFTPKSKGCCCNIQFEEVPQKEMNTDKKETTEGKAEKDEPIAKGENEDQL